MTGARRADRIGRHDDHIVLGTDRDGAIHHLDRQTTQVHIVTTDGEREQVNDLLDHTRLNGTTDAAIAWMDYVDQARGWRHIQHIDLFGRDPWSDDDTSDPFDHATPEEGR